MSDRQGKTDAERQQLEDEKRELEVQKLRHDISIWARVTAVVIPIAAFIIGGAQAYIAFTDWSKKQASDVHDAEMKQIEMGVRLVEFASLESKTLTSTRERRP